MTRALPRIRDRLRGITLAAGVLVLVVSPIAALLYAAELQDSGALQAQPSNYAATGARVARYARPANSHAAYIEDEVKLGCWQVQVNEVSESVVGLSAHWNDTCPIPGNPTRSPGHLRLTTETFYLSAWGPGTPRMATAKVNVRLTEDLADTEDVAAGMLFLPATQEGKGYFVAGWQDLEKDGTAQRGLEVGRADAPPSSVNTRRGRVFFKSAFNRN